MKGAEMASTVIAAAALFAASVFADVDPIVIKVRVNTTRTAKITNLNWHV